MQQAIINKETGAFRLSDDFSVNKDSSYANVLVFFNEQNTHTDDYKNGWTIIRITDHFIQDHYFNITFRFENGLLKSIDFILSATPYSQSTDSWDNWSYDKEMQGKQRYDKWLTTQVGGARNFHWGSASAWFDERGGGSSITLRYL